MGWNCSPDGPAAGGGGGAAAGTTSRSCSTHRMLTTSLLDRPCRACGQPQSQPARLHAQMLCWLSEQVRGARRCDGHIPRCHEGLQHSFTSKTHIFQPGSPPQATEWSLHQAVISIFLGMIAFAFQKLKIRLITCPRSATWQKSSCHHQKLSHEVLALQSHWTAARAGTKASCRQVAESNLKR